MKFRFPLINILLPVIAGGMLLYALVFAFHSSSTTAAVPLSTPPESPYAKHVAGIGIVEPTSENIMIGTFLPGIVTAIPVVAGQQVKAGDVLFTIDDREAKAELHQAQAKLDAAKVAAEDAHHQLSLYEKVTDKRAISEDDMSKRRYGASYADAQARQAQADVEAASTMLERLSVRAPIDAQILKVNLRLGEFAQAGDVRTPLMIIGDTNTMHVRVEVDETEALKVDPNALAQGTLRGHGDQPIKLTFVRKEGLVTPKRSLTGDGNERVDTRVQEIIYGFDNNDIHAYSGQQMDVFIDAAGKQE